MISKTICFFIILLKSTPKIEIIPYVKTIQRVLTPQQGVSTKVFYDIRSIFVSVNSKNIL